ncbi:MAG TPA: amidase [Thermoanaerobaculia bacterium]|jgi:Asp-tRNA(Asn)/Glu-tRNA(Gln) amidotransferase A subunit family amidase|nr:amidase [Thermoanaerobaculia bacterium]
MTDRDLDALASIFAEREPDVLAFLPEEGRFERLRRDWEALERRWPDPARRPPLFGVPVGVKDIFHVAGFETRGGSRLPPEELKGPEAASVTALREAGALILGKTVSTEFAFFAPGPTRNPWNPEHTPGGSSSGSAAAVGAGLCPLALGTQTIGSIMRPAAFCGAVGFKPSYERISREGIIPLAPSLDHIGFFTPDVAGAMRAASVLCRDWLVVKPARKPRLGVPEGPFLERASGEGLVHFRQVCHRLADAGFEIVHVPALPDFGEIVERHFRITAAEMARVHRDWFARFGDLYAEKTAELIRRGQTVTDDELERDLDDREELRDVLTAHMDDHRVDLWISPPALGAAPRGLDSTGDPVMNVPWSQAGMPAVCLPAGRNANGLPLGLQVSSRWWTDESLLCWAADLENTLRS